MSKKRKTETETRERYPDELSVERPAGCVRCGSTRKDNTHNHIVISRDITGTDQRTGLTYTKVTHIRTTCASCGQKYKFIRYDTE